MSEYYVIHEYLWCGPKKGFAVWDKVDVLWRTSDREVAQLVADKLRIKFECELLGCAPEEQSDANFRGIIDVRSRSELRDGLYALWLLKWQEFERLLVDFDTSDSVFAITNWIRQNTIRQEEYRIRAYWNRG